MKTLLKLWKMYRVGMMHHLNDKWSDCFKKAVILTAFVVIVTPCHAATKVRSVAHKPTPLQSMLIQIQDNTVKLQKFTEQQQGYLAQTQAELKTTTGKLDTTTDNLTKALEDGAKLQGELDVANTRLAAALKQLVKYHAEKFALATVIALGLLAFLVWHFKGTLFSLAAAGGWPIIAAIAGGVALFAFVWGAVWEIL